MNLFNILNSNTVLVIESNSLIDTGSVDIINGSVCFTSTRQIETSSITEHYEIPVKNDIKFNQDSIVVEDFWGEPVELCVMRSLDPQEYSNF